MGSKLVNIVSITLMMFVFALISALIVTDYQLDRAIVAINDFADNISVKGYMSQEDYNSLLSRIPMNNIKIQLTHIDDVLLDSNGREVIDAKFGTQIFQTMQSGGNGSTYNIYKMDVGDTLSIELYQTSKTPFDAVVAVLTGNGGSPIKKVAIRDAVIVNTKYEK